MGADDEMPGHGRHANQITRPDGDGRTRKDDAGQAETAGAEVMVLKTRRAPPLRTGRDVWRRYGWEDDGANVIFPAQFRYPRRVTEQGPVNAL